MGKRPAPAHSAYQPVALDRVAVEKPFTPSMRALPTEVLDALHADHVAEASRWSLRTRLRSSHMGRYVVGAVLAMFVVNALVTPLGWRTLPWQILVYGVYGAVLALLRPTGLLAVGLTVGAGFATFALAGLNFGSFAFVMSVLVWVVIGLFVSIDQESKATLRK